MPSTSTAPWDNGPLLARAPRWRGPSPGSAGDVTEGRRIAAFRNSVQASQIYGIEVVPDGALPPDARGAVHAWLCGRTRNPQLVASNRIVSTGRSLWIMGAEVFRWLEPAELRFLAIERPKSPRSGDRDAFVDSVAKALPPYTVEGCYRTWVEDEPATGTSTDGPSASPSSSAPPAVSSAIVLRFLAPEGGGN